MPILTEETLSLPIPRFTKVRQIFKSERITDIDRETFMAWENSSMSRHDVAGKKIALAVGSRGIRNLSTIVRATGRYLESRGAKVFIVPAMGSHGGANAQGQSSVLEGYGISESDIGIPVVSTMATSKIAETSKGRPIYFSQDALAADMIIPIARIKPHTDFRGKVESGLCKMLAIGLGKHQGCSTLHKEGFQEFSWLIPEVAERILAKAPVAFGLAILENAYDQTSKIEVVEGSKFLDREPELLKLAMDSMPRIIPNNIDVLVVREIGKDISGAGMDPNIIGRTTKGLLEGYQGPGIKRIIALAITPASKGNATGIGLSDFTVKEILPTIDYMATNANCIASGNPEAGRIPIAMESEADAIRASISCAPGTDPKNPRIVRIKNTLDLEIIEISDALLDEARMCHNIEVLD
jgi:hypothetical protein